MSALAVQAGDLLNTLDTQLYATVGSDIGLLLDDMEQRVRFRGKILSVPLRLRAEVVSTALTRYHESLEMLVESREELPIRPSVMFGEALETLAEFLDDLDSPISSKETVLEIIEDTENILGKGDQSEEARRLRNLLHWWNDNMNTWWLQQLLHDWIHFHVHSEEKLMEMKDLYNAKPSPAIGDKLRAHINIYCTRTIMDVLEDQCLYVRGCTKETDDFSFLSRYAEIFRQFDLDLAISLEGFDRNIAALKEMQGKKYCLTLVENIINKLSFSHVARDISNTDKEIKKVKECSEEVEEAKEILKWLHENGEKGLELLTAQLSAIENEKLVKINPQRAELENMRAKYRSDYYRKLVQDAPHKYIVAKNGILPVDAIILPDPVDK